MNTGEKVAVGGLILAIAGFLYFVFRTERTLQANAPVTPVVEPPQMKVEQIPAALRFG